MKIITDERCTAYARPGHPERPARITKTLEKLSKQTELPIKWGKPASFDDAILLRAHTSEHIGRLKEPGDFDADTAYFPEIAAHARASVGAALEALKAARAGESVFSLMRPPGHHATQNRAMGFCYLNNIAIAVLDPLAEETLEAEDYYWLGQSLRKLGLPLFSLLEGGYSNDLGDLVFAYLKGI